MLCVHHFRDRVVSTCIGTPADIKLFVHTGAFWEFVGVDYTTKRSTEMCRPISDVFEAGRTWFIEMSSFMK